MVDFIKVSSMSGEDFKEWLIAHGAFKPSDPNDNDEVRRVIKNNMYILIYSFDIIVLYIDMLMQ